MVTLLSISFYSCQEDNFVDSTASYESRIIGKWEYLSELGFTNDDEHYDKDWEHNCSTDKDYIEFKSNGMYYELSYNEDCDESSKMGSYKVIDHTTITFNSNILYTIISVNDTHLTLGYEGEHPLNFKPYITFIRR